MDNQNMEIEHLQFKFTMEEVIRLEPMLKEWFGIDRNNQYLQEAFKDHAGEKMQGATDKEEYKNEKGHYDIDAYIEAHFESLAKEELSMKISTDNYLHTIDDFCVKNQLEFTENNNAYQVLLYAYALLMKNRFELTEATQEDMNYEYQEYIHAVRPDMLKLYIGLHDKNNSNTTYKQYHKHCRISFGDLSPITIDEQTPWFQETLDRYLEKYLGVKSVKEAMQELNSVYGKTVGAKPNVTTIRYMWGTYHFLQTIPNCKSKTEKSVTRKQGRIIADLLNRFNLINYKNEETYEDYADGERTRTLLKKYLMDYDSIDDIINERKYKLSPNNKDTSRFF